jgi:hypothetical protein
LPWTVNPMPPTVLAGAEITLGGVNAASTTSRIGVAVAPAASTVIGALGRDGTVVHCDDLRPCPPGL